METRSLHSNYERSKNPLKPEVEEDSEESEATRKEKRQRSVSGRKLGR